MRTLSTGVLLALGALLAVPSPAARAQEPVAVGKGSYASTPPPGLMVDKKRNVDLVEEVEKRRLYLVKDDGAPVPSNKWYQNLIFQPYGTGLWAMPHKVDATAEGIEIFQASTFSGDGMRAIAEFPLVVTGQGFKPADSRAKAWTDWTVAFRMFESDTRHLDVTLGEGMPAVWCEFTGVKPALAFGGIHGKGSRSKNAPAFFGLDGAPAALPVTGDALGIAVDGRTWGVFGPDGTTFAADAGGVAVGFPAKGAFLVICPLPDAKSIALFRKTAFAVPRDTRLSWSYDRAAGTLTTTWKVEAEPLKGTSRAVLQGWLPHHWRDNAAPLALDGPVYTTIRGPLKCATGDTFTLRHPYQGILPNLPAPKAGGGFDAARVSALLKEHFADSPKRPGADTYWGGKDLERYAQAAFIAAQLKDPSAEVIARKLRAELENWLTFTPGEKERFFAYYPRRKGLVGFNASYGSQHFTDQHFHYGYYVYAAGLLSQLQPDFAAGYGEMARLIARTYANHDRKDARFPFFRTFDIWRGHSFADGNGFPDGNNQESTGEAVNSWAGMILLGEALGDPDLTAAGVMGYTFESRANLEYWFDPHGDVFPSAYAHEACGMIWCNGIVWGTWFTASPAWIYGIQWIPTAPHGTFYDRDRAFIKKAYAGAVREQEAFEEKEAAKTNKPKKPADVKSLGGELASYHLGFVMHADPAWVVEQIDKLWAEPGDKVAHDPWMANVYYQAHALKELGRVDWACHGNSPTSAVYLNESTKARTLVAWNPTAKEQAVSFVEGAKPIGTLKVPPHSIASAPAAGR
jgi:endoglucanase Acf2